MTTQKRKKKHAANLQRKQQSYSSVKRGLKGRKANTGSNTVKKKTTQKISHEFVWIKRAGDFFFPWNNYKPRYFMCPDFNFKEKLNYLDTEDPHP